MSNENFRRVFLESPFSGDEVLNERYLTACELDCINMGESPYASHRALTRALKDSDPVQRAKGIKAGQAFREVCESTVVYVDLGISGGMQEGIDHAKAIGHPIKERRVPGWKAPLRTYRGVGCWVKSDGPHVSCDQNGCPHVAPHCMNCGDSIIPEAAHV